MKKPNVILIMTDDQGYGDLGCMGSDFVRTPNIDALANSGVLFTSMYSASPVCSPARASLLTGRYPGNAGVRAILAGHRRASGITPSVPTLASALKKHGYATGISGKWHLGLKPECRPNSNGFDEFNGFLAGCVDYYSHIFYWGMADGNTNPTHDLWEDEKEVYDNGEYLTERITAKSIDFIRRHKDESFMLYVAYNAPHYPMHAPQKYLDRFRGLPWDKQIMAAMLSAVDDGVGEICAELEALGLRDDTIIYFQSDNGPSRESRNWLDGTEDPYYGGTAGKLSGHKFSLFDGGIRVPAVMSWRGKFGEGTVNDVPHISVDIFPTIMQACADGYEGYELDGISIFDELSGGGEQTHDCLFWEMEEQTAVRSGKYKLVINGQLVEGEEKRAPLFLSDMEADPGEKINLADELPELAAQLKAKALGWRSEIEENWRKKFAANYSLT